MTRGYKKKVGQWLDAIPANATPARRYFSASNEDFAHILKHNAERGLVPVVRRVGDRTVFSFCPRNACFNGRISKLRGVMVEVFDC